MSDQRPENPLARTDGIVIEEIDDGLIVFDRASDTAHWLDPAAAMVWKLSDGRGVSEIAQTCAKSEVEVADVLLRLEGLGLMVEQGGSGISRRIAFKKAAKVGGTAVAGVAVISTVIVPNALATSSVCDKVTCTVPQSYQDCSLSRAAATAICTGTKGCRSSSTCDGHCTGSDDTHGYTGTCSF